MLSEGEIDSQVQTMERGSFRELPMVSIVVPTFREAENLPILIPRIDAAIEKAGLQGEIIVVDDNSPDNTVAVCEELASMYPLRLEVRKKERGLSSAVLHGMKLAKGDVLICMDADLSHPPESIPKLVEELADPDVDFVIGSRYVAGGSTDDRWSLFRWLNSKFATLLARPFTRACDPMAGFFALRREDFNAAEDLNPIGYKIGLELLVKCGCREVREVPIYFQDRTLGESKLTLAEQLRYLQHLCRLAKFKYGSIMTAMLFAAVGVSGLIVDLGVFSCLLAVATIPVARVIAIWIAMTWNFVGNRTLTFSDARRDTIARQYVLFCASCILGGLANWAVSVFLSKQTSFFADHVIAAGAVGAFAGACFNYISSTLVAFRS